MTPASRLAFLPSALAGVGAIGGETRVTSEAGVGALADGRRVTSGTGVGALVTGTRTVSGAGIAAFVGRTRSASGAGIGVLSDGASTVSTGVDRAAVGGRSAADAPRLSEDVRRTAVKPSTLPAASSSTVNPMNTSRRWRRDRCSARTRARRSKR